MTCVATLAAQSAKDDPVAGYWRSGMQVTEFKGDGTLALIRTHGENMTASRKGKWTVAVSEKKIRHYEIIWESGESENIQMLAPYDLLLYGAGSGPGVYGARVKHLKVFFWSNAAVNISCVGGYQKADDFPQYLTMHLFVRRGDTLGISLRNISGKISFGLEGIENGRTLLRSSDFRYSKRFDSRWLDTTDLKGYEQPVTVHTKGLKLGEVMNAPVVQTQKDDLNAKALYYKYVFP